MARARNIKPGFFANEELVELSFAVRLLFIGLWTIADRAGRLEDKPKKIKMALFPADNLDIDEALAELEKSGFIQRYEAEGTRYIQILAFSKHQNPHKDEKASTIPAPCEHGVNTVQEPKQDGGNPADSLLLIPDSLNPDSGSPVTDSQIPDPSTNTLFGAPPAEDAPVKAKPVKKQKPDPPTAATWASYAAAYEAKYHTQPVRNATVNAQLAQLVGRLGGEEAPQVAAWYVGHRNQFYVGCCHSVAMLLRDAEKLRMEWVTGRQGTQAQAIQSDKTQANFNAFAPLIAEARAQGEDHAKH